MGRDLLRAFLPVIASFESRRRSERVRVAMKEIKSGRRPTRSGRPPGRPRIVTNDLVNRAAALRAQGKSWARIAQSLGPKAETCRRATFSLLSKTYLEASPRVEQRASCTRPPLGDCEVRQ